MNFNQIVDGVKRATEDSIFGKLYESAKKRLQEDDFQGASDEELSTRPEWVDSREEEKRHEELEAQRRIRREYNRIHRPNQDDLIHQFVENGKTKGRASSVSIEGDVLISYRTPIAVRKDGNIYMVDQRFSNTTSKTQYKIRWAATKSPGDLIQLPVPEFKELLDEIGVNHYGWLHEAVNEDDFKGADDKEVEKRRVERLTNLTKKGVKIDYIVKPMPDRLSSFWYE